MNEALLLFFKPYSVWTILWTFQILGGCQGRRTGGGGDSSIEFINFGRVGDKILNNGDKNVGRKGGWQQYLDFFVPLY